MSATMVPLQTGVCLNVVDGREGPPVLFQHGLGGDRKQVEDSFPQNTACRRITVECRGHGLSQRGPDTDFSISGFANDVLEIAGHLSLTRFAIGGISMGAAIAMRLAVLHPQRVSALMLVRPAWLTRPAPANMQPFAQAADCLRRSGRDGKTAFAASETARRLAREAPDNLASLLGFFDRDDAQGFADVLTAIAQDGPGITETQLRDLRMPVLIVGHDVDFVHPLAYARRLAAIIPGAHLAEITPKAVDRVRYTAELRATLAAFLKKFAAAEENAL